MDIQVILNQMIIIFLLMMIGCLLAKKNIIDENGSKMLSDLIVTVLNPAIIISSAMDKNRAGDMGDVIFSLILAIGVSFGLIVLGMVIPNILRCKGKEKNIYEMMSIFGNIGFIGIPLVAAVLGKGAVIFVTMYNLPYNVLIYTYGVYLLTKGDKTSDEKQKIEWKSFFSPGTIASILALVLFGFQIPLPEVIVSTADYLGNAITPLSMIVIGISLAQISLKEIFGTAKLYLFCFLRLIMVPIVTAICIRPFVENEIVFQVTILLLAMPVGSMNVIMAKKYDTNVNLAARGVVLSTILSVITVPIVAMVL